MKCDCFIVGFVPKSQISRRSTRKAAANKPSSVSLNDSWLAFGICVFLGAITWFVFGQTLRFEFVNFDDTTYVLENPHVARGLTTEGIAWAFTQVQGANWHPLTWLSHMLDSQLHGLNPQGHHLTNVLLHSATAILLFLVLRQMTGAIWRSAFVAAIFAIHPLRVESVAWVAERKDVLSGLFFVLTIAAYVRYARRPWSPVRYGVVVLLFALGLMSKPMLVTLPFVLLLLDYWPLNRFAAASDRSARIFRIPRRLILEKLPLVALAIASGAATLLAQKGSLQTFVGIPLSLRIANALAACATYLRQMFWPVDLAVLYPFSDRNLALFGTLSFALLAAISAVVFLRRHHRYLVTGWLWYLIMLGPVLGILQVGNQAHADRYTYLPQIGVYLLLTWMAADLSAGWRHRRPFLATLGIVTLGALTFVARTQASYWQDSHSLWARAIACTSDNAIAHTNLAEAFFKKGKLNEAIEQSQKALQIDPSQAVARSALGLAFLQKGRLGEAVAHLQRAVEITPTSAGHSNLGVALMQMGRVNEALAHYNRALEIDPDNIEAQNNMAWVLATWPEAEFRDGTKAVSLAERADSLTGSSNIRISVTLAACYAEAGRFAEAVKTAQRALHLAMAQGNMARVNSIRGQIELYQAGSVFRDGPSVPKPR
jgi:tetratricopeptide (TPR) repeat protein